MGCFSSDTKPKMSGTYGRSEHEEVQDAVNFYLNQGAEEGLVSPVEIHLSCKDLKNMDVGSLTDSACVVRLKTRKSNGYTKVGQTEVITDNLNPVFVKFVTINYSFEERQDIQISVYDLDDFDPKVSVEQNLIGNVEFRMDQLLMAPNKTLILPIKDPKGGSEKLGNVVMTANERKAGSRTIYKMQFRTRGFRHPAIFYRLNKFLPTGQFVAIYESETSLLVKPDINNFKIAEIYSSDLTNDNENQEAMIEIFKWDKNGNHKSITKQTFLITKVLERVPIKFPSGQTIEIPECIKKEEYSFLSYIFNGLQLALTIAVDFTLSNGVPTEPTSLHHFDMNSNQYLRAITSVGHILENYDSDKMFPILGFGAKVPALLDKTSHCFALNGNIFNPEVPGIEGVIQCYKNSLNTIKLNGPTFFAKFLSYMNDMVEYEILTCHMNKYYIFLILTDGLINDMEATTDEIVRATSLPISIIIIGVGDEDFTSMNVLDADDTPLYSKKHKKYMERDIVQFVSFNEYKNDPIELAKQTLEEVPRQLVSYMSSKGISPRKELLINMNNYNFFDAQKAAFIQSLITMGFSEEKINEILNIGLPENSTDLFKIHAFNPYFRNPLAESASAMFK